MGTSWISRNGGILEKGWVWSRKGGYDPLTNHGYDWFHSNFYITITDYKYTVTNNLDQIQFLIYRLLSLYKKWTSCFQVLSFLKICQHKKMFCLNTGLWKLIFGVFLNYSPHKTFLKKLYLSLFHFFKNYLI